MWNKFKSLFSHLFKRYAKTCWSDTIIIPQTLFVFLPRAHNHQDDLQNYVYHYLRGFQTFQAIDLQNCLQDHFGGRDLKSLETPNNWYKGYCRTWYRTGN